jgi:hypothetical protein
MTIKKKFVIEVYSNKTDLELEDGLKRIYKDLANLVTINIKEVPFSIPKKQQNEDWVKKGFDLVNWAGNDDKLAEELIEHIQSEHRSLIQSFFRTIQKTIEGYALHTVSDHRNEGSLDWAKIVAKIDYYMPHI